MHFLAVVKAHASPRSLTLLTILSLILSLIILALSAANDSTIVLCLNVVATAQTVVYHLVVIPYYVWRRRARSAQRSSRSRSRSRSRSQNEVDVMDQTRCSATATDLFLTQCIVYCAVILALWSGAFVFAAETALVGRKDVAALRNVHPWDNGVQISIVIFIGMELGVMVLYLRSCFLLQFSTKSLDSSLDFLLSKEGPGDFHGGGDDDVEKGADTDDHNSRSANSPIRILHETFVKLPPPALINDNVKSPNGSWVFLTPKREST